MSAQLLDRPKVAGPWLRLLLATPFAFSAASIALDFESAESALRALGLPLPGAVALIAVTLQASGAVLLLSRGASAAGAVLLAAFTLAAGALSLGAGPVDAVLPWPGGQRLADQVAVLGGLVLHARIELREQAHARPR